MRKILIILLLLLGALVLYGWQVEPNRLEVTTVNVEIFDLSSQLEGFTILHLSDLHLKRFGPEQDKLLEAIASHDYDMVAITGDLLDHPSPTDMRPVRELLAGLDGPIYYVYGNHDYPEINTLTAELEAHGVRILANSRVRIHHNGGIVQVAGIHDPYTAKLDPLGEYQPDLSMALQGANILEPLVLLSHSPGIIRDSSLADWGVDLVLAGHTHGGQVKVPLLGAPVTGSGRYFDKYVEGLYQEGTVQMYVNRGLGTTSLPFRILSRPEVAFITLTRAGQ